MNDNEQVCIHLHMAVVHLKNALCLLDRNSLSTQGHECISTLIDVVESLINVL